MQIAAALKRAEAVQHPHTQAYVCYYASVLHALRGEFARALKHVERCIALSEEHGFGQWQSLARAIRGISMTVLDTSSDTLALDEVRGAFNDYRRAGYALGITALDVLWCPALLLQHQPEAALEVIEQGLATAGHNSERIFEAELYRLKARVLLVRGGADATARSAVIATPGFDYREKSTRPIAGALRRERPRCALDGSEQARRGRGSSGTHRGFVHGRL